MRTLFLLLFLAFILFPSVSARETDDGLFPSPATGKVMLPAGTSEISPAPGSLVLPLSVRPGNTQTLSSLSVSEKSMQAVLIRERGTFQSIRKRLLSASASEQGAILTELGLQRQRLLISILNRLTVVYQKIVLIEDKLDVSLLRLRSAHSKNPRISNFETRIQGLEQEVKSLKGASARTASQLESCPTSVNLGECVKTAQKSTTDLLVSLRTFLSTYRTLVQEVLSA
jgi:hypothetical protein